MIKIKAWRFFPVMMALVLVASVGAAIVPAIPVKATCSTPMVAAGGYHTVGLKSDATVVAVGYDYYGQCSVGGWTNITQVAAGGYHTVGLKSDGTVFATGDNSDSQCEVSSWPGITQVAAGDSHTVGLKSDGTVVAVGNNGNNQLNVGSWTGITQVAAGGADTAGLKSDGTVVVVGQNDGGQRNVGSWTGITQVSAGGDHTVGLKSDGTVVAVGYDEWGQCSGVSSWTGITQVAAGHSHTVGLKSDGTVVAVGRSIEGQCNVGSWTGITQVAAGGTDTAGLKSDGTVVAVGNNGYGQCNVGSWNLRVTTVTCTAIPNPTEVGHAVNFTSSASCGVPPYTYSWAFGDGGTSTAQNPNHTYTAAGTPTATVTVTDSLGHTANCSKVITVTRAGPAHRASPTLPNNRELAQMSLQYLNINPQQTSANQPVIILTNVVNSGDEAGSLNVALKINGQVEQTKIISVGPQATQPVKFTVTKAQPGTYAIDIGGQTSSFTILGASSTSTSRSANVGMIAILFFGVLVLIAVVGVLLARRPA
jgi:PKD repeat protein